MPRIIGIAGEAGSGKDTVADMLREQGFIKIALADPIKRAAKKWWGFSNKQLWGPSEHRFVALSYVDLTARKALQFIGTEIGRVLDPDVWTRLTLKDAKKINKGGYFYSKYSGIKSKNSISPRSVVITDVRFISEIHAIQKEGGEIWLIKNPETPWWVKLLDRIPFGYLLLGWRGHLSEREIRKASNIADIVLLNDKTKGLEFLRSVVLRTLKPPQ